MTVNQWLTILSDLNHTTDPCLDYRSHHRVVGFCFVAFVFFVSVVLPVHGVTENIQFSAFLWARRHLYILT